MRWMFVPLAACGGGGDDSGTDPVVEACFHVAEGTVVDTALQAADAPVLDVGIAPYRVNLRPGAPGYVAFEHSGLVKVSISDVDVLTSSTSGELPVPSENPECPDDIPEVYGIEASGRTELGLGPAFVAAVWMMVTP